MNIGPVSSSVSIAIPEAEPFIGGSEIPIFNDIGINLTSEIPSDQALTTQLGLQQTRTGLFFLIGRYAFLGVAVPAYAVAWELPKWTVTEGLPKLARATHQYVLLPIYNGVVQVTKFFKDVVLQVAQAIYKYALKPLGQMLQRAFTWAWESVVIPIFNEIVLVCEAIKDVVIQVAQAIYKYALKPLGQMLKSAFTWTWGSVVIPIFNGVALAYEAIKYVVVQVAQAVYKYALKPSGQFIGQAFRIAYEYTGRAFTAVVSAGNTAVHSIHETYGWLTRRA